MSNLHILNLLYAASFLLGVLIVRETLAASVAAAPEDKARLQSLLATPLFSLR